MRRTLFDSERRPTEEAYALTIRSLETHAAQHDHWSIAFSGGKDSTTVATLIPWLIETGQIERPKRLTVLYADTRMEMPPLAIAAARLLAKLNEIGIETRTVTAPLDRRFFVYILGRGVPPPNNNTLRWCTRQIKVEPMQAALDQLAAESTNPVVLTGVRLGESAVRDERIAVSCSVNGAECGQGWYQHRLKVPTLAPILHWRVCQVWDWLRIYAPRSGIGWETQIIADAYGGDEAIEQDARTGCIGCPLASRETALETIAAMPQWGYLTPLLSLKPLYRELREPRHRLRKQGGERRKDGSLSKNQNRMGPIRLESRLMALERILAIQAQVNAAALRGGRPEIDILDEIEEARIRELIEAGTWPQKWSGDEPIADEPFEAWQADGAVQANLFGG